MRGIPNQRKAFTLIELLVVVAIIALLISIAVPSINAARDSAKGAATLAKIKGLGDGCELFNNEIKRYPQSSGRNPFETGGSTFLSGAQWLALQITGPDLEGYVNPRDPQADTNGDNQITSADWLAWYSLNASQQLRSLRRGPYVTADGAFAQSPERWVSQAKTNVIPSDMLKAGTSDWSNDRLPMFIDNFGFPILYYAANAGAAQPFATGSAANASGVYDQSDNAQLTGGEGGVGFYSAPDDGTSLGRGTDHPLRRLGYTANQQTAPERGTFAHFAYDRKLFDQTQRGGQGRIRPVRADTYLLISPGKDGLWGTSDDVKNY